MDICTKQKELFFNNLLLLEFDTSVVENEYRVKCDKDMFSVPNQKMFEVVTHFLFEKLKAVSQKEYNLPWPLIDKELRRQFQKSTVSYLSSIAEESVIKFPRVVMSVISTFGGDRFYELYLAFSSHVVERTIRKNNNVHLISPPSVSKHNSQDAVEMLKILIVLASEKLQEVLSFSLKSFDFSLRTSNNFITHIQKLKSSLATNSSLLKEKNAILASLFPSESDEDEVLKCSIEKIFKRAEKTKRGWKQFSSFFEKERKFWDDISPAIKENSEACLLDGAQLKLDFDDSIKELYPELNKICLGITQEEKVCLLKYLNIYSTFLELYEKKFLKGDLPQMKELSKVQKTWSFQSKINELQTLNEKLTTVMLNIKENNEALQGRSFLEVPEDLQIFAKECPSWNFNSQNFQNEINTNRSMFTDKLTDILKTSLFADSGLESGVSNIENDVSGYRSFASSSTGLNTFGDESTSLAASIEPNSILQIDEFHSCREAQKQSINLNVLGNEKLQIENFPVSDLVQPSRDNPVENAVSQSSLPHTPELIFDIDLEHYRTRQTRESWLTVEPLDSITFPETSFLD